MIKLISGSPGGQNEVFTLQFTYLSLKRQGRGIRAAQPMFAAEKAGLIQKIGKDNVRGNIDDALVRARQIIVGN